MSMDTITIKLDYGNGPVWKDCPDLETGAMSTGISLVDNDETLSVLDDDAQRVYSSLYECDSDGEITGFDEKREVEMRDELIGLIAKIKARLDEINDGTYAVIDEESERLAAL